MATLIWMQGNAVNSTRSKSIPKAAQAVYDAVVALTDAFCRDHLNDEFRDLAQAIDGGSVSQAFGKLFPTHAQ
jgi:hypothetical protein